MNRPGPRSTLRARRRTRRLTPLFAGLIGTALVLLAAGCGSSGSGSSGSASPTSSAQPTDVTLVMDWLPWVLDIPVDVAQEKGYYADAGLRVKQVLPAGPTDVVKFVSTGKAQFGLYYAPDTLMAIGEGAPLVSVAALMSHAPVGMAMASGVKVNSPKDLAGQTVGVIMIPSTRASFDTMLKEAGVEPGDVKVVDPGFDLVTPLLAGKYVAVSVTQFAELVQAEAAGGRFDYMDFRDWGTPDFAFLNVVTSKDEIAGDPGAVQGFVSATMAGLGYALEHPEEAVDIYVARHPELKRDLLLAQWKAAAPSMAAAAEQPAGWQDVQSWKELALWMTQSGLLKEPAAADTAVSNDYLGSK